MNTYSQDRGRAGAWLLKTANFALVAALFCPSLMQGQALNKNSLEVPPALSEALGWKIPVAGAPRVDGRGAFTVGSEPSQWRLALEPSKVWAEQSPAMERAPGEYVVRKLARIEALALAVTDRAVLDELRAERKRLGAAIVGLRNAKADAQDEWRKRSAVNAVGRANRALGEWLADSPADRVELFRDTLAESRPASREQLAERYGGEERLTKLIARAKDYNRLMAVQQEAFQLPEEEQRQVIEKAAAAMSRFYEAKDDERGWQAVRGDPDLAFDVGGRFDHPELTVPGDLLLWAGEEEATRLLGEAYALRVPVSLDAGSRTGGLARRLIVEGKIQPAAMPWSLVAWEEDAVSEEAAAKLVVFYDVLRPRFDLLENNGAGKWTENNAQGVLALALASEGRGDEALMLAKSSGGQLGLPYRARITPGMADAAWDLMLRLSGTAETEKAVQWENLERLAQAGNRGADLAAFAARQAMAAAADSTKARRWRERHGWALIATGDLDAGLERVNAVLEADYGDKTTGLSKRGESLSRLFLLAKALERPEIAAVWRERLGRVYKNPKSPLWENHSLFEAFAEAQLARGEGASLEALLRARAAPRATVKRSFLLLLMQPEDDGYDDVDRTFATIWLADVLGRLGRHGEVVELLAKSPNWGGSDIAGFMMDRYLSGRSLPLIAAESLHAEGRTDEAVAIMEAYVAANTGYDPGYALYTRLLGGKAASFLEKLRVANRFEERPLIWLATLNLAAGDVAGAESLASQAIAIDPSDGEQPKGDRMRAYAVLREVALKKGDTQKAAFLAGVLAAIRRSENADDLAEAGLAERAIKEYRQALESFSDAYCIQSRLARQLAEENRLDEAVEHYKRAFELMPDSFGRVESHCFGCERAFAGKRAQSVAERVFTEMAAKPDAKPQVHYLLGYLRTEQDRWDEAAEHFSRATAADPDYLNAWKMLLEVLPRTARPRAEQDRVAFRLLELDPKGTHVRGALAVRDLPALWRHYASAAETLPPTPAELFPLGDKSGAATSAEQGARRHDGDEPRMATVPERFARHRTLDAITQAMDAAYAWHTGRN